MMTQADFEYGQTGFAFFYHATVTTHWREYDEEPSCPTGTAFLTCSECGYEWDVEDVIIEARETYLGFDAPVFDMSSIPDAERYCPKCGAKGE